MKRELLCAAAGFLAMLASGDAIAESYRISFSTFFGGSAAEGTRDVEVDSDGNIYVVSRDALQSTKRGARDDAVIVKLSPDLDRLVYSTSLGGGGNDAGRDGCVGRDGALIVAGSSSGADWPTKNAALPRRKGPGDAIVARLTHGKRPEDRP